MMSIRQKRKHDTVDEILVQEMAEDDAMWTNFEAEKAEVLRSTTDEMMQIIVQEALRDCEAAFLQKFVRKWERALFFYLYKTIYLNKINYKKKCFSLHNFGNYWGYASDRHPHHTQ